MISLSQISETGNRSKISNVSKAPQKIILPQLIHTKIRLAMPNSEMIVLDNYYQLINLKWSNNSSKPKEYHLDILLADKCF